MGYTLTTLSAPSNVVATAGAGGTVTDGTYYILVVAYNYPVTTTRSEDTPSYVHSPPSEIKTVTLGSGNNTFNISWDSVTGASSYKVYITNKSSGDDRWSATGVSNLTGSGSPTTSSTSVSISDETKMWKGGLDWFCYSYDLPEGLDKNTGRARLDIDGAMGTITIDDILAELPTGQYAYEANQHIKLLANIIILSGTTGTLTLNNKTITNIHSDFLNSSGGTFTRNFNGCTWNMAGNYGSFALNEGDRLFRCTVRMGSSTYPHNYGITGLAIDPNNTALIQVTKRCRLNNFTDLGYNLFTGVEIGYVAGNLSNSTLGIIQMNMSGSTSTVYDIDGVNFGGRIQYDYWVTNAYKPRFKNCTIRKFSLVHLVLTRKQPTVDYEYYDCTFEGNSNNLPTVMYNYAASDPTVRDATENNVVIYNSIMVKVTSEDNIPIEGATISLINVDDEEVSDDTDADGLVDFGYLYINHMTSSTPQVRGSVSTVTTKNPFMLTITKAGYETYKKKIEITSKTFLRIGLSKAIPVFHSNTGQPVLRNNYKNSGNGRDIVTII
jgi:hypothetical protein